MKTPTIRFHLRSQAPQALTLNSILSDSELQALASKLERSESLYIMLCDAKREYPSNHSAKEN